MDIDQDPNHMAGTQHYYSTIDDGRQLAMVVNAGQQVRQSSHRTQDSPGTTCSTSTCTELQPSTNVSPHVYGNAETVVPIAIPPTEQGHYDLKLYEDATSPKTTDSEPPRTVYSNGAVVSPAPTLPPKQGHYDLKLYEDATSPNEPVHPRSPPARVYRNEDDVVPRALPPKQGHYDLKLYEDANYQTTEFELRLRDGIVCNNVDVPQEQPVTSGNPALAELGVTPAPAAQQGPLYDSMKYEDIDVPVRPKVGEERNPIEAHQVTPHDQEGVIPQKPNQRPPRVHLVLTVTVTTICTFFNYSSLMIGLPALVVALVAYVNLKVGDYPSASKGGTAALILTMLNILYTISFAVIITAGILIPVFNG